jgi:choline transport protein
LDLSRILSHCRIACRDVINGAHQWWQYHWVSGFAPRKIQKPLSYFAGWMSTLSWVSGTAGGSFIFGVLITSILVVYNPSYSPQPYQTTLFVFAVALVQGLANTVGASQLPRFQKLVMIPHG